MSSMIALLESNVAITSGQWQGNYLENYKLTSISGDLFYITCKYQSDFSGTPRLCYLNVVSFSPQVNYVYVSQNFQIEGYAN
jgi:hypothetical protein